MRKVDFEDEVSESTQLPTRGSVHGAQRAASAKKKKKRLVWNIVLQIFAMIGLGFVAYPTGADWVSSLYHDAEISGYVSSVRDLTPQERTERLDAAYAYNDQLQPGPLVDPYLADNPDEVMQTPIYKAYLELLRVTGTDAIGQVTYPSLGIGLPIYHGTSDAVIAKGVGHMFGSSLPVGGPSTHSLLTAHSGLPNARLFTQLLKAQVGDQFRISVLGEDHYYEVRSTETVLPDETESLNLVEGEDRVTLFTCTPISVNSHRFLVHAERIEAPDNSGRTALAGDGMTPGFPWWLVAYLAASALVAWMLFAPVKRKKKKKPEEATTKPSPADV